MALANLQEIIAQLIGRVLTDDETERVLKTVVPESTFHSKLRNASSYVW